MDYESKLRKDFLKCLSENSGGNVVDELISVLKKDYILLVRVPLSCRDCIHFNNTAGWIHPNYCAFYQRSFDSLSKANDCSHYFSGKEEARKSMARLHNDLTGDLFYE